MDERAALLEGFDYDLWANSAWADAIPRMPRPERPKEVMEHVAWAQNTWIQRVHSGFDLPEGDLKSRLEALHGAWKQFLNGADLSRVVDYRSMAGEPFRTEVAAICRHVLDHGTYHRGQLRGLAEMQAWDAFPDVGLIGFYRTHQLHQ